MKSNLFLIAIFLCCTHVSAQQKSSTSSQAIQSIELGEVTVKNKEQEKLSNKVKPQHVTVVFSASSTDAKEDSTFFATRFPFPETDSISLNAVELKLKPFDTALFDIKLIVYQMREHDTLRKIVPIAGEKIDRKGNLRLSLYDEEITLHPGDFYIGYGFHKKRITEPYQYRMYSSNKGKGAILTFKESSVSIVSNELIPYVFPFRISYQKF